MATVKNLIQAHQQDTNVPVPIRLEHDCHGFAIIAEVYNINGHYLRTINPLGSITLGGAEGDVISVPCNFKGLAPGSNYSLVFKTKETGVVFKAPLIVYQGDGFNLPCDCGCGCYGSCGADNSSGSVPPHNHNPEQINNLDQHIRNLSGFQTISNEMGETQFSSGNNKDIQFEGLDGTEITFDPEQNKVQIKGGSSLVVGTYSEIKGLKGSYVTGRQYAVMDFVTKHLIPNTNDIHVNSNQHGDPIYEPLIMTATSDSSFSHDVKSLLYPEDLIKYDFEDDVCEDNETPRNGWIYDRTDTKRRIHVGGYDFRGCVLRRAKITGRSKETMGKVDGANLDLLLTFSPNMNATYLNTYRRWQVEYPVNFTHDAGELNLTIRKGSQSYTRPLMRWDGSLVFDENELADKKGEIVYDKDRDVFISWTRYAFGEAVVGTYGAIGTNSTFSIGNGLRYEVDVNDYIDVPTFPDGATIHDVNIEGSGLSNNVFFSDVTLTTIKAGSVNNTFMGQVSKFEAGTETYNNLVPSSIYWSEWHNEVFNNYIESISGAVSNLNIRDTAYRANIIVGNSKIEITRGISEGGNIHVYGGTTELDYINNSGIVLLSSGGLNTWLNIKLISEVGTGLVHLPNTQNATIIKNAIFRTIYDTGGKEDTLGSTKVESLNIDFLQSPEGAVSLVGRDSTGRTVDATHLLDALAPPVDYIQPTINLTTNQISTGREVGEVIDAVLTAFYNKNDAGDVTKIEYLKNGSVIHTINDPSQSTSYTDEDIVLSTTPISYTARITYEQGPVKNNALGNPSPSGRIEAGSLTSVQRNALGTYIVCFGAVSSVPANSAQARSMTTVVRGGVNVRILDCGTVDVIQAILLPPGTNLVSVIDLDASMQDLTIQYILEDNNFTVNDASGNPVTGYKLYVRTQGTPYPTNHRHQFTMS